jgi:hypothetical protein
MFTWETILRNKTSLHEVKLETKRKIVTHLPVYENEYGFKGYDSVSLMAETAKLRKLITKRGT